MEIIRSGLFSLYPEIEFGMSTRKDGVSPGKCGLNLSYHVGDAAENVQENRQRFFDALHVAESAVAFPQQCHSDNVQIIVKPGQYETCDGLATNERNLFLAVSVADCVPIFLYDKKTNAAAGIHAGWRGTASHIVENAVRLMNQEFGSNSTDVVAFIGPAAGQCCYEVGNDVAAQFSAQFIARNGNGKLKLDLKSANCSQLIEAGLLSSNIEIHPACTICTPELFHSYRRDGKESGRMLGIIGIR